MRGEAQGCPPGEEAKAGRNGGLPSRGDLGGAQQQSDIPTQSTRDLPRAAELQLPNQLLTRVTVILNNPHLCPDTRDTT